MSGISAVGMGKKNVLGTMDWWITIVGSQVIVEPLYRAVGSSVSWHQRLMEGRTFEHVLYPYL
jgi:hypothetical protein